MQNETSKFKERKCKVNGRTKEINQSSVYKIDKLTYDHSYSDGKTTLMMTVFISDACNL